MVIRSTGYGVGYISLHPEPEWQTLNGGRPSINCSCSLPSSSASPAKPSGPRTTAASRDVLSDRYFVANSAIDTQLDPPKRCYVKSFVRGFRSGITAARSPCSKLRMLSATMNRVPASKWHKHNGFRQRSAGGCHGWYRAPASQPLTTPGPSHLSNAVQRRVIRPASRCLRRPSRGRIPCWKDADEPAQTSCHL